MAETIMIQQLPRPKQTRSEDLIASRRYGYFEEGKKDYSDGKTKQRPTRSEDLYRRRRWGYVEAAIEERRPSPITSILEYSNLQARKRYGYVEKDQTDEIFSRKNNKDQLTNKEMQEIIVQEIIDNIFSRENRGDYLTNKETPESKETLMIQQIPRHINARSEDLHLHRRYGYFEEGNEDYLDVKTEPRHTRSEDLHKSRRNGYVETDTGERRLSPITLYSECIQAHKRYGYVEKDQTGKINSRENRKDHQTNKEMPELIDFVEGTTGSRPTQSENLHEQRRHGYAEPDTAEATSKPSIRYLFWKAKWFQHFHYVYNLVRDCKIRVEKLLTEKDLAYPMRKDVIVKIGILGDYTEDNIRLISKRPGKSEVSGNKYIWNALPLACFENESSSKSKLTKNVLRQEKACHKIFIRSDTLFDKKDEDEEEDDDIIVSVGQDKDQIEEIITSCLEEPLHQMLTKWSEGLKRECVRETASDIIVEIEAIRKKLVLNNSKDTSVLNTGTETNVPDNVKDYLFGRSDVNAFGLWSNSSFKVFVKKTTDVKELRDELIMLNKHFFQNHQLEMDIKRWRETPTLMQGDSIHSNVAEGTLGGFVTKTNDDQMLFALSCNHLFPNKKECAYTHDLEEEIGTCLFTTRYKGCDFAAIKIKESYLDSCDVAFRRDDKKKINAKIYSSSLEMRNIVHKIGATTGVTNGIIVSSEFYLKVIGKCNRENIFLVKGTAGNFSKKGDSGSLVFSRPNRIQQDYVDVIGMVYASDLTLYDDDVDDDTEDQNKISKCCEGYREEGAQNNEFDTQERENDNASDVEQDTKDISFCFRIDNAIKLFKENQGDDFEVKFKNDLSPSSPLSSSSSESEDLNEENN